ncbi:MAG TPA: hypothetical protein DDZ88_06320 [Verrucomicrobiales bacterium]|nr:hypothetical protein [Verrucomicrobiales bacterium]
MRFGLFLSLVCASGACACTIPVFRYALDRWEADKFHLVLPASAAQDTALQDLLRPLRANGKANLDITTSREAEVKEAELRSSRDVESRVWSGTLDQDSLAALLDSPARIKIVESILAGDSFIWVITDNGSPQDAAEVERIENRLRFLEQVAALPLQDPNDPDSQLGPGPPLRLKFTTLRLRSDDPEEKVLLKMLAGPKGEFDPASTSFAAPVFGKGRVLGAWPLALLDDATLEEASLFLVGRCGCRIKNENPGWDLLLNVDWETALPAAGQARAAAEETGKPGVLAPQTPEVVAIMPEATATDNEAGGNSVVVALGALILGMLVLWWLKSRRA